MALSAEGQLIPGLYGVGELAGAQCVTKTKPTDEQQRGLELMWRVVKHVKSNAIVFGDAGRTLAVGGGATSRVDAVHAAASRTGAAG